ncbi:MAG: DUF2147 domain-containing protein [Bacteroidota bacterium]
MKSVLITFSLFLLATTFSSMAPLEADQICGKWLNEEKSSQIEIFEKAGKYYGKVIWIKEPNGPEGKPKLDLNNPDESLRDRPILGLVIISDLNFKDGKWINGKIYAPGAGQTADCNIELNQKGELELSVSKSFFSKTKVWTRL